MGKKLNGFVKIYNENGIEVEKVLYENNIKLGNPFIGNTTKEIVDLLGISELDIRDYETMGKPDEENILDKEFASTLLLGKKYGDD